VIVDVFYETAIRGVWCRPPLDRRNDRRLHQTAISSSGLCEQVRKRLDIVAKKNI
jgi:hypothetical protein